MLSADLINSALLPSITVLIIFSMIILSQVSFMSIPSFQTWLTNLLFVGTMGPGPAPLASWPSPRTPKGLGPEANRPRKAWTILRPGTPKGLGPKANRPRNVWPILCPGARASHIPDVFLPRCFLSRSATPPNEAACRLFMV